MVEPIPTTAEARSEAARWKAEAPGGTHPIGGAAMDDLESIRAIAARGETVTAEQVLALCARVDKGKMLCSRV